MWGGGNRNRREVLGTVSLRHTPTPVCAAAAAAAHLPPSPQTMTLVETLQQLIIYHLSVY